MVAIAKFHQRPHGQVRRSDPEPVRLTLMQWHRIPQPQWGSGTYRSNSAHEAAHIPARLVRAGGAEAASEGPPPGPYLHKEFGGAR